MEHITRYIQSFTGDAPWIMRLLFSMRCSLLTLGCMSLRLSRLIFLKQRTPHIPVAMALIFGIGIGNIYYILCAFINIGYYAYYIYYILKCIGSKAVDPLSGAVKYIANLLGLGGQVQRHSRKITGIVESAVEQSIDHMGGVDVLKERLNSAKNAIHQPIKNAWHVYRHREEYQYHNISLYDQYHYTSNENHDFVDVIRAPIPAEDTFELIQPLLKSDSPCNKREHLDDTIVLDQSHAGESDPPEKTRRIGEEFLVIYNYY